MTRRKQSTRWWLVVCVAAFGVLLLPPGCSKEPANPVAPVGPNPPGVLVELHGKVHYVDFESQSYKPWSGATVRLDSGTASAKTQVSDSTGAFLFSQVSQGVHHLRVSEESIVTLDTQVVASLSMADLALVVEALPVTEIFPLAVGASWVYDYLYRKEYYMDGSTKSHTWWQKGSVAFHVLGVSDEGSRRRWTIHERDDLHLTDTLWFNNQVAVPPGDTSLTTEHVFSMYEESYGFHKLQADSCSVLWQSPQAAWALGTEAKALSRYCLGETESFSLYQSIMHNIYLEDSLTFSRNVGLVRYEQRTGAGNISRYYDSTWGTLRSYTPGQGAGAILGKRPWR
jgi:hypothetical protein